jgi:hypothetical protein
LLFGIVLTVIACMAAVGTWGRPAQIAGVIALGLGCVIADLKAER